MKILASEQMDRIRVRLERLYGAERTPRLVSRLALLAGRYQCPADLCPGGVSKRPVNGWSQRDAFLMTYGDMIRARGERPLVTLRRFIDEHLEHALPDLHILPFFPYSSDDGFAIIDHRAVNDQLGSWEDVDALAQRYRLMFDLVVNHVSRQSSWFKHYVNGIAPYRHYFVSIASDADLSAVVRPRSSPLYTTAQTRRGERHLWTTFSADEPDLRWSNCDVLFEFLDILLYYVSRGARIIRLNAVAYLWKELDTASIDLPQTHEVVKLLRDVLDMLAPGTLLVADSSMLTSEDRSYLGEGDEAHLVYQSSLPALLLHALHRGTSRYLKRWLRSLAPAPAGCSFLNFTASHDGIGIAPLDGLIPDAHLEDLVTAIEERGGYVSTRTGQDGLEQPHELNISYFDALSDPGEPRSATQVARFMCSQSIMLALQGIPVVYFHSLTATHNDQEGVNGTGQVRAINRSRWDERQLVERLGNPRTPTARVFHAYIRLLKLRGEHPSFHPDGAQRVLDLNDGLFGIERTSPDGGETVLAISNLTASTKKLQLDDSIVHAFRSHQWEELITGKPSTGAGARIWQLAPYESVWLRTANTPVV